MLVLPFDKFESMSVIKPIFPKNQREVKRLVKQGMMFLRVNSNNQMKWAEVMTPSEVVQKIGDSDVQIHAAPAIDIYLYLQRLS